MQGLEKPVFPLQRVHGKRVIIPEHRSRPYVAVAAMGCPGTSCWQHGIEPRSAAAGQRQRMAPLQTAGMWSMNSRDHKVITDREQGPRARFAGDDARAGMAQANVAMLSRAAVSDVVPGQSGMAAATSISIWTHCQRASADRRASAARRRHACLPTVAASLSTAGCRCDTMM